MTDEQHVFDGIPACPSYCAYKDRAEQAEATLTQLRESHEMLNRAYTQLREAHARLTLERDAAWEQKDLAHEQLRALDDEQAQLREALETIRQRLLNKRLHLVRCGPMNGPMRDEPAILWTSVEQVLSEAVLRDSERPT